jgi:cystathionine beta-lyase
MYNFDKLESRKGTKSLKFDYAVKRGMPEGIQPLWVADMDFPVPKEVSEALIQRCNHGIFGYSGPDDNYFKALNGWFERNHKLTIDPETVLITPGIVFAINLAIRAFTNKGDSVLIQQPVYYPFFQSIKTNERKVINSPLINQEGHYEIDFEDLEQKMIQENVKLFILCSPHNPVGRVWTKKELERIGDLCLKHQIIVIADEIHCDFTAEGHIHTPFINVKPEYREFTITCTAPSKTFNLAGLHHSNIIIPNKKLKQAMNQEMNMIGGIDASLMGLIACEAAYNHGEVWLEEVKEYIKGNLEFIKAFLKEYLPEVAVIEPEGTYLIWLDFRALGLSQKELDRKMIYEANLWLDGGTMFGEEGTGYQRVNITTSRENIRQAMEAIVQVFKK